VLKVASGERGGGDEGDKGDEGDGGDEKLKMLANK
jgi:hypothetical protein